MERFIAIEAASGVVLMIAAVAALVWANSPWRNFYADLWHIPIGFHFGGIAFERDLHFWINDGLMTIFFFVVGLEIRREMHVGELSDIRRAALPLAAALGGMLLPAIVFLALPCSKRRNSQILCGSGLAGTLSLAVGYRILTKEHGPGAAETDTEAEASTSA